MFIKLDEKRFLLVCLLFIRRGVYDCRREEQGLSTSKGRPLDTEGV